MGASSRARGAAAVAAAVRAARHRRLKIAWLVVFPAVVLGCVLLGIPLDDVVGGLRTGVIFGGAMAIVISLADGSGHASTTSSYVDPPGGDACGDSSGDSGGGSDC